MKQHISISQLNELSKKGKEYLVDWFVEKNNFPALLPVSEDKLLFSIGQMIEFLDENKIFSWSLYSEYENQDKIILDSDNKKEPDYRNRKHIYTIGLDYPNGSTYRDFHSEELCDVLFNSMKEILKIC